MPEQSVKLPLPLDGQNEALAFNDQPPTTTIKALNVRPESLPDRRARIGTRPGLQEAYGGVQISGGQPVRMLEQVRAISGGTPGTVLQLTYVESFNYSPSNVVQNLGAPWTKILTSDTLPIVVQNQATNGTDADIYPSNPNIFHPYVRARMDPTSLEGFVSPSEYTITTTLVPRFEPPLTFAVEGAVTIYPRVASGSELGIGVYMECNLNPNGTGSINNGKVFQLSNGAQIGATFSGSYDPSMNLVLKVVNAGTSINSIQANGVVVSGLSFPLSYAAAPAGDRTQTGVGFRIGELDIIGEDEYPRTGLTSFLLSYVQSTPATTYEINKTYLVAAAGDTIQAEKIAGTEMEIVSDRSTLVGSQRSVNSKELILGQDRGGLLYIADYGGDSPVVKSGTCTIAGSVLTDAAGAFTSALPGGAGTLSVDVLYKDFMVELYSTSGSTVADVYEITAVTATTLTLSPAPGNGSGSYKVQRGPKIYNPVTKTITAWKASPSRVVSLVQQNQVPLGCPLITLYRDRMVLAGRPPQQWYMSRAGFTTAAPSGPLDWDYGADTTGVNRPVASISANMAGQIPEPLTALINHSDDYLIFSSYRRTWVMRGDPVTNGVIDVMSHVVGCIQKRAWCYTPEGAVVVLSHDGLYIFPPGAGSFPEPLSRPPLPARLESIDVMNTVVTMAYSTYWHGIEIYVTHKNPSDSTRGEYWFFDWKTKNFWEGELASRLYEPTALLMYFGDNVAHTRMLIGSTNGKLLYYDPAALKDVTATFFTRLILGPYVMNPDTDMQTVVREVIITLGEATNTSVTWKIFTGSSAEEAAQRALENTTPEYAGTITGGTSLRSRPRTRAYAFCILLENLTAGRWTLDSARVVVESGGLHLQAL